MIMPVGCMSAPKKLSASYLKKSNSSENSPRLDGSRTLSRLPPRNGRSGLATDHQDVSRPRRLGEVLKNKDSLVGPQELKRTFIDYFEAIRSLPR